MHCMIKKVINQNSKLNDEIISTIESKFEFANKPINRFNFIPKNEGIVNGDKRKLLKNLKNQINSIENCKLKENSDNIVLGEGN